MIKFFRKIRQNLLTKGKTATYLKYAVGEIILVVIGILIALSINNWNQKRLIKIQSDQVLLNLKTEVTESKLELENNLGLLKLRIDKRLDYLNDTESDLADSIKIKKISEMLFYYNEGIKLPIIESELGPNKKIIQWPELSKQMQELSESIAYYNKGVEYLEKDIYSNILPFSVKQGVIIDLMVNKRMLKFKKYLNADVYNNEDFRNVIASSTFMTSALLEGAKRLLNDYDKLLEIINKKVE
jgi:hypothetical protein